MTRSRSLLRLAFAAGFALVSCGSAFAFGDAVEGKTIAMRWCAACHLVADNQTSASVAAPTFTEIKKAYGGKMAFLEAFLSEAHPQMPDMNLAYQEIQDLVAYFEGL